MEQWLTAWVKNPVPASFKELETYKICSLITVQLGLKNPQKTTIKKLMRKLMTILPQITMEIIKYFDQRLKKMLHIKTFGMQLIPLEGIL